MEESFASWFKKHGISEVECLVPDMNGVIRGKVWPAGKFVASVKNDSLRLPSSVFSVTVTGQSAAASGSSIVPATTVGIGCERRRNGFTGRCYPPRRRVDTVSGGPYRPQHADERLLLLSTPGMTDPGA